MKFTDDTRRKLVGLLGRLGSNNDNEILAAVRLINSGVKAMDKQWDDLIAQPVATAAPKRGPLDFNSAGSTEATPKPSETVIDMFGSVEVFEAMLEDAETAPLSDKEETFVADMRERFSLYGERTFISPAQLKWLYAIAGRVS